MSSEENHLQLPSRRPTPRAPAAIVRKLPYFRVGNKASHIHHSNPTGRRRRMPSIRLGKVTADGARRRRGAFLVRAFRRIRLRWLKLYYSRMLRRLRSFYAAAVRELVEAGKSIETVQSRIMMESYGAVAIMPVSVAALPSNYIK